MQVREQMQLADLIKMWITSALVRTLHGTACTLWFRFLLTCHKVLCWHLPTGEKLRGRSAEVEAGMARVMDCHQQSLNALCKSFRDLPSVSKMVEKCLEFLRVSLRECLIPQGVREVWPPRAHVAGRFLWDCKPRRGNIGTDCKC